MPYRTIEVEVKRGFFERLFTFSWSKKTKKVKREEWYYELPYFVSAKKVAPARKQQVSVYETIPVGEASESSEDLTTLLAAAALILDSNTTAEDQRSEPIKSGGGGDFGGGGASASWAPEPERSYTPSSYEPSGWTDYSSSSYDSGSTSDSSSSSSSSD